MKDMLFNCKILYKLLVMLLFLIISIASVSSQSYDMTPLKGKFTMEIAGNPESKNQPETNVTIIKVIDPSNDRLQYRYDIIVPPVDDFHFVLALDSSSSLKSSLNSEQAKAIIEAIPNFINSTIKEHGDKNFEISIVSWDNDTDFVYSPLNNKNPKLAKLIKIQNASTDLVRDHAFGGVDDPAYKYICLDEDHTNLSQPLKAAIDVLDMNPPIKYHRTSNFTIIVVGDGEYTKCEDDLINDAHDKGYAIYAILMGHSETSDMFSHLQKITGNDSRVFCCIPINEALEDELEIQLRRALETAISEPAAEDVVLTDHLNRFIPPGQKASIEVVGFPETHQDITPTIINNSIMIRLPNGLSADNTTRINIDAYIKLKNLTTSANKMPLLEDEYSNSKQSNLSYCWLRERYPFEVPLPNSSINISGPISSASQETKQNGRSTGSSIWLFLLRILGI